jgi:hypothetical protein
VPTSPGKQQVQRPLTSKELRAKRKRIRDRERHQRRAEGIRPIWSLPAGQPVRRNYILSQVLLPFASAAAGARTWSYGAPPVLAIIIGAVFWLVFAGFIAWSCRKAWPY